jgi:hypothetical protein
MSTNEFTTTTGKYLVTSFGNGWAYSVLHQSSGTEHFFQDADAEQLREDTDNFASEDALDSVFECLEP